LVVTLPTDAKAIISHYFIYAVAFVFKNQIHNIRMIDETVKASKALKLVGDIKTIYLKTVHSLPQVNRQHIIYSILLVV
jgi:hypothetical protein